MLKTIRRLFIDVGLTEGHGIDDGFIYSISERAAAQALNIDVKKASILIANPQQELMIDIMGVVNPDVLVAAGMTRKDMPVLNPASHAAFEQLVRKAIDTVKYAYAIKNPNNDAFNNNVYFADIQDIVTHKFCEAKVRLQRERTMLTASNAEIIMSALEAVNLNRSVPPRKLIRSGLIPQDAPVLTPDIAITAAKKYAELYKDPNA